MELARLDLIQGILLKHCSCLSCQLDAFLFRPVGHRIFFALASLVVSIDRRLISLVDARGEDE
eukprot:2488029-Rhodomonas_salina.1